MSDKDKIVCVMTLHPTCAELERIVACATAVNEPVNEFVLHAAQRACEEVEQRATRLAELSGVFETKPDAPPV